MATSLQAPLQPMKMVPAAAEAERTTLSRPGKTAEHWPGHEMPAGHEVTAPFALPVVVTSIVRR